MKTQKIVIMAGGTGGHVFPGLALAENLQQAGVEVHWLGTQGGMEAQWVQAAHLPFNQISIKGLRGNGWLGWLKAPYNVVRATWQAKKVLQQIQPDLVLGMGGFVCGPGGLATKLLGLPLVLHEQNALPGLTNRLLAPFAKMVMTGFAQTRIQGPSVFALGNPVRSGLETLACVKPHSPRNILVLGGSRGALALNETVPKALALMPENLRPNVVHQTGSATLAQAQAAYQQAGVNAEVLAFIDDMQSAYAKADLVISRAGALTVSELMAAARPAILVPYPHAVDDHQTENAKVLVNMGGAVLLPQTQLTSETLAIILREQCDADWLSSASNAIREVAPKQAKEQIVAKLLALIAKD